MTIAPSLEHVFIKLFFKKLKMFFYRWPMDLKKRSDNKSGGKRITSFKTMKFCVRFI